MYSEKVKRISLTSTRVVSTCKRVFMVSKGVVMQEAVAPAIIPPAAWTEISWVWLGANFSEAEFWPKNLQCHNINIIISKSNKTNQFKQKKQPDCVFDQITIVQLDPLESNPLRYNWKSSDKCWTISRVQVPFPYCIFCQYSRTLIYKAQQIHTEMHFTVPTIPEKE